MYTIISESQHLFIYGVPQINLRPELKNLCLKYGPVLSIHVVTDYETERFTECYHVHFEKIQAARIAKRLIDNKSFYGGVLHVCYAPELESLEEIRLKLLQRKRDVLNRLGGSNLHERKIEKQPEVNSDYFKQTESRVYEIYHKDDPILADKKEEPKKRKNIDIPNDNSSKRICPSTDNPTTHRLIPSQVAKKQIVFRKNLNKLFK